MARILVDEALPRLLAKHLRDARHDAHDVRDLGLRGQPDGRVLREAQDRDAILITLALDKVAPTDNRTIQHGNDVDTAIPCRPSQFGPKTDTFKQLGDAVMVGFLEPARWSHVIYAGSSACRERAGPGP